MIQIPNEWIMFVSWVLLFVISSAMIVIFFADVKYRIIPDEMLVVIFFVGLITNIYQGILINNFIAASVICFMFYVIYSLTKRKGMGFGDVKLAFIIGWLWGIKLGLAAVYFSFIIGGIFAVGLLILKKANRKSKIAFGPFLIIGMILSFVLQKQILEFIINLYG